MELLNPAVQSEELVLTVALQLDHHLFCSHALNIEPGPARSAGSAYCTSFLSWLNLNGLQKVLTAAEPGSGFGSVPTAGLNWTFGSVLIHHTYMKVRLWFWSQYWSVCLHPQRQNSGPSGSRLWDLSTKFW